MTETRYIVQGVRTKTVNRKSEKVWLEYHNESGGAFQWGSEQWNNPYLFTSEHEALASAKRCPGPWFNEPDPETIEVREVEYTPPTPAKIVFK